MDMYEVVAFTTTKGLQKMLPKSVREEFAKAHGADSKHSTMTYFRVDDNTKGALQGFTTWKNSYLNRGLKDVEYFNGRKPQILNTGRARYQFFSMDDVNHFIKEFHKRKVEYDGVCNNLIQRINDGTYQAQIDKVRGDLPVCPLTVDEVVEWKSCVKAEFYTNKPDGLMGELLQAYENGKKMDEFRKTIPIRKYLMDELRDEIKHCTALLDPAKPRKSFKGRLENLSRIKEMIKTHLDNDADGEFAMLQGMHEKVEEMLRSVQESTSKSVSSTLKDSIESVQEGLKEISYEDIFECSSSEVVETAKNDDEPTVKIEGSDDWDISDLI